MNQYPMLPFQIIRFTIEKAMQIGREIGEFCPYWYNQDILDALILDDKDIQNKLREKYLKQCHEPIVIYRPDLNNIFIKCNSCDITSGIQCNRLFPLIAEKMLIEIKESFENE